MALFSALTAFLAFFPTEISGPILYSIHRGETEKAFESYLSHAKSEQKQDFFLLQQAGKALLEQGIRYEDPEIQLMCMFGAGVASSCELQPILEKGLKSGDLRTQLIALSYLCKQQDDEADLILLRGLSSPFLITRLEILLHLAQKNHPAVMAHLHSLAVKVPPVVRTVFAEIAIHLEGMESVRYIRQLLNDPDPDVRVATILTVAREKRDDFLPSLHTLANGASFATQEALAIAFGALKDQSSRQKLKQFALSNQENVKLAACVGLYELGEKQYLETISTEAKKGSLFAISALGTLKEESDTLFALIKHPDRDVRLNATLALLMQRDRRALDYLEDILIDAGKDIGFWSMHSSGGGLKAFKCIPSASQHSKEYPGLLEQTLKLKEKILTRCIEFDEDDFLKIASLLIKKKQHDLIPLLVELLQNLKSEKIILFLKAGNQKAGAPFIRNYCTLALYKLKECGPYEELLIQWIKEKGKEDLIRFREEEENPLGLPKSHQLTPQETSRFLVEACEALASAQNQNGVEALIHTIAYGNPKNRYALAGLLMRTTE